MANLKGYAGFGGDKPLPGMTQSQDRFVRASYYIGHLPTPSTTREAVLNLLSVLQNVAQPYGTPSLERPSANRTVCRTISDLTHHVYYYNSTMSFNIIYTQLDKFNLSPGAPIMKLDLVQNPDLAGDVTNRYIVANA